MLACQTTAPPHTGTRWRVLPAGFGRYPEEQAASTAPPTLLTVVLTFAYSMV